MWTNNILPIVLTEVKIYTTNKLNGKYSDINFTTSTKLQTNPKFPTVMFRKLQGSETDTDFEGEDINGIISNIQIDVIDNVSQTRANNVADIVMAAMKDMRYRVIGDIIIDESDSTTYKCIARYSRVRGRNDTW